MLAKGFVSVVDSGGLQAQRAISVGHDRRRWVARSGESCAGALSRLRRIAAAARASLSLETIASKMHAAVTTP
jgi:selenocysteine lyase/cysteine desulfurase